jgi:hypothetical protein
LQELNESFNHCDCLVFTVTQLPAAPLVFVLQHLVQFIQARQGQCGIIYARLRYCRAVLWTYAASSVKQRRYLSINCMPRRIYLRPAMPSQASHASSSALTLLLLCLPLLCQGYL